MRKLIIIPLALFMMGANLILQDVTLRDGYTDYCQDASAKGCWRFNSDSDTTAIDESNNNYHLAAGSTTYVTDGTCKEGNCWDLTSGSSHSLQANQAIITAYPFSMCAWFKTDSASTAQTVLAVTDTAANNDWWLVDLAADGSFAIQCSDAYSAQTAGSYTNGVWYHACGVFKNDTSRSLYIDGAFLVEDTGSCTAEGADDFCVGVLCRLTPTQYFDGKIDEVILFDDELTAAEILDIYTHGLK